MKVYLFVFVLGRWTLVADCPELYRCIEAQHIHHAGAVEWHRRAGLDGEVETLCTVQSLPAAGAEVADLRSIGPDNCPRLRTLIIQPSGKPKWPGLPSGDGITSALSFGISQDGKHATSTRFVTWINRPKD